MKTLIQSLLMLLVFTVLTGVLYPLLMTGAAQVLFPKQANGSLVVNGGVTNGSLLIGQIFTNAGYFVCRPSWPGYDATNSGGFNYGPASSNQVSNVTDWVRTVRDREKLPADYPLPADMVTASASGLDPDISVTNARIQAKRVAIARKLPEADVIKLIDNTSEHAIFGFWGVEKVNVLKLNLALDRIDSNR